MKSNQNDQTKKRHRATVRKNIPVLLKAIASGIVLGLIQYAIHYFHLSFPKEDENVILFIIFVFAFFAYVIFAGYAVNKVMDESKEFGRTIMKGSLDDFLLYRDERLPFIIHLPIGVTSFILVSFSLFFHYPEEIIGVCTVFSVVFIMTTIFLVTNQVDSYEHSSWFKEKTPPDWWTISTDEHFKKKKG